MDTSEREELLGLLAHVFETREDIDGFVYLDIQKVFYHLRDRLDDDNEIKQLLPYYWYIDGPVSDTVQETVDYGRETGALESQPTARTGSGEWFNLGDSFQSIDTIESEDFEVAKRELENVLDEDYDIFSTHEEKVEDIYEDAPYEFQQYFKFDVLFELERFANNRPWAYDPEELKSRISTAEAFLPLEPEFEQFNALFSRYVNTANRYFDFVSEEDRRFADRFKQLSESIWRAYCQQVRMLEHDEYYESYLEEWEAEYEWATALVESDIMEFRRLLESEIEGELGQSRMQEESTWGKIVTDYLDESEA